MNKCNNIFQYQLGIKSMFDINSKPPTQEQIIAERKKIQGRLISGNQFVSLFLIVAGLVIATTVEIGAFVLLVSGVVLAWKEISVREQLVKFSDAEKIQIEQLRAIACLSNQVKEYLMQVPSDRKVLKAEWSFLTDWYWTEGEGSKLMRANHAAI